MIHSIRIDESDRQVIILALAELSIARPGWVQALNDVSLKLGDEKDEHGQAIMYEAHRQQHTIALRCAMTGEPVWVGDPGYPTQEMK